MKTILLTCCLIICGITASGQGALLTGTLYDSDGVPLPGASVVVEGTSEGTQTDFDGNYAINCAAGDVLVITYIGMNTRRITVTPEMFAVGGKPVTAFRAVRPIRTAAYAESVRRQDSVSHPAPGFGNGSVPVLGVPAYFDADRIRALRSTGRGLEVDLFPDDFFYEVAFRQRAGVRFVPGRNLPRLQTAFAQGRPSDGSAAWFGPETGETFAYGPRMDALEFDGAAYPYDSRGRLVPAGQGNGATVRPGDNGVFHSGLTLLSGIDLKAIHGKHQIGLGYQNSREPDRFNRAAEQLHSLDVKYDHSGDFPVQANLMYRNSRQANANANALHEQVYYASLATPPSFDNSQGYNLTDGSPRSFSPGNFNPPGRLLAENGNILEFRNLQGSVTVKPGLADNLSSEVSAGFSTGSRDLVTALPDATPGFPDGYRSAKMLDERSLRLAVSMAYDLYLGGEWSLEPYASAEWQGSNLDFTFREASDAGPLATRDIGVRNSVLFLKERIRVDVRPGDVELSLTVQNNPTLSDRQGSMAWLPAARMMIRLDNGVWRYSDFMNSLTVQGGFARSVSDHPLYYDNLSHNSLNTSLANLAGYTANNDLFLKDGLALEHQEEWDLDLNIVLLNHRLELSSAYSQKDFRDAIFPVFESGLWRLDNVADLRERRWESAVEFSLNKWSRSGFRLQSRLAYTRARPEVRQINTGGELGLPVAGFPEVSANLIPGYAPGTLVGSAFQRDALGRRVIGPDGFPLVDPEKRIIGNPVPDFSLGWTTTLGLDGFSLQFLWDLRQGGEIWNGTQWAIDYLGNSEKTARQRGITGYIFDGVNPDGSPNSRAVDFAPADGAVADNRWVRYGPAGVAEEAVSDGSYLNLKYLSLGYQLQEDGTSRLFREVEFGSYARNLWTRTRTRGANPYSSLLGGASGSALHFFNLPLATEIGVYIHLKI